MFQDMTINEPRNGVKGSFNRFKDLVLRHSVERPPWSMGIFAIEVRTCSKRNQQIVSLLQ